MKEKVRLDMLLVSQGIADTRSRAQALIMAGCVRINGINKLKCGDFFPPDTKVEVVVPPHPYVSRGGLKLEKALSEFSVDVKNLICIDAGASTGGFTDCLLQHGASKVYAVDVGYGQIALKLRNDPRIVVIEKCNVRYLTNDQVPEKADLITADLSFISLTKVLPKLLEFLKDGGIIITLIKPQFEAGRKHVKKGVVKDPLVREQVVKDIVTFAESIGLTTIGTTVSPIEGPSGNVEFLGVFNKSSPQQVIQ